MPIPVRCTGSRPPVLPESREEFARITEGLAASGAEGVILGCTEIGLLLKQDHVPVPLFDTAVIHAEAAAAFAAEYQESINPDCK